MPKKINFFVIFSFYTESDDISIKKNCNSIKIHNLGSQSKDDTHTPCKTDIKHAT